MSVKRFFTSVSATIGSVVTKFENHEAVADSVIDDVKAAMAKVKTELVRISRRRDRLRMQQESVCKEVDLWKARAIKTRDDEEKAIACVKLLQRFEHRQTDLSKEVLMIEKVECDLNDQLSKLDAKLFELQNRKSNLIAEQAKNGVHSVTTTILKQESFDAAFDRWEDSLVCADGDFESITSGNLSFAEQFEKEETLEEAKARLEALRSLEVDGHD